jgi:nucleoside-diphosphate-sugar epimerase
MVASQVGKLMHHPAETILVTGAGGFVGGTLVEALHFAGSYHVRAGIARWSSAPRIARLPITLVQCDVLKPVELAEAFTGVDYVIHCAAGDDLRIIVEGTQNVLCAAAQAGIKRVVHMSSIAVYGGAAGAISEDTQAPPGTLSAYGAAKVAAEELCEAAGRDLEVVVMRPSIIYGPFSTRWTMLCALRLKSGRWKQLGALGEGKCNLVHVHDVARYAIAAVGQNGVAGGVFNINGPEVVTWNDYFERFNYQLGMSPMTPQTADRTQIAVAAMAPMRAVGKYALRHHTSQLLWLSHRSDFLKRVMQRTELTLKCTPNQDELTLYGLDARYLTDKAERAFGFRPKIGIDAGLAMSVAWLDHMGEGML